MKLSQSLTQQMLLGTGALALTGAIAATGLVFSTQPAMAQAAYGSYIGVGGTFGVTNDSRGSGDRFGGVVAVRYKVLEFPISLRAQTFVTDTVAFIPSVSYDIPFNWQGDVYIGVGPAFGTSNNGNPSPIGDKTSFAIQPGVDYAIPNSNLVVFGNAVIAFDAYKNGGGTAAALQGGVGLRF